MSELKPGWRRAKFGQLVECVNDRVDDPSASGVDRYIGLEHLDPESLTIQRWGTPADVESTKLRFKTGDIIFGKRRAYQRKLAVATFEGICSAHAMVLRAKPGMVLPEFLPFFMYSDTFMERAQAISVGSLSPTINWRMLAEEEFALPPLEKQRSIAGCLVACAAALDAHRELCLAAKNVLASSRNEHFSSLPRSVFSKLASGLLSSAYGPRFSAENYSPEGNVRSIRTTDMPTFGSLTLDTAPAAVVPSDVAAEHRVRGGDFLISRTGFTSGRAAVFRGKDDETIYIPAAFLIRLRLDSRKLEPEYLLEYIQSVEGWKMIRGLQRGTQQLNISASALVERDVPMPALAYQQEVLEQLSSLHKAVVRAHDRLGMTVNLLRTSVAEAIGGRHEIR